MSADPYPVLFVGRERELSAVAELFVAVQAGSARVVLLEGDPGAGKSALVAQACARLAGEAQVAVGGCVDIPGVDSAQVPFGPFVEALRRLLRADLGEPVAQAVDGWLNPGPDRDHDDQDPVHTRFADVLSLIGRLTSERPLVLVLEDLHWADQSSLALLVFLARNLTAERVLIIATTRSQLQLDSAAQATFDHLLRLPAASTMTLDPLPDEHVLRLVQAFGLGRALSESDAAAIVLRAEGNPLVARELAANPQPAGAGTDGVWVPPTLAASVRDRVRRCSVPARAVLAATAVLGGTANAAVVDAMLSAALPDVTSADHRAAVREASATGLLLPDGDGYRFRHGLDREVIYADLWPDQRRRLHADAAESLANQAHAQLEQVAARVATHWQLGGDHEATRRYSLIAARTSAQFGAFPEAHAHYERALATWTLPLTVAEEAGGPGFDLLLGAAETASWAGQFGRGLELARAALGVATSVEQEVRARESLVRFSSDVGDSAAALGIFEQKVTPTDDGAPQAAARALATHARSLMMMGRYGEAAEQAREALTAVTDEADSARSSALITLGVALSLTGEVDEGLDLLRQGGFHAKAHGHDDEFWRAQVNTHYVLGSLGRYQEATDAVLESLASRPSGVQDGRIVLALANAAQGLTRLGHWQRADALAAEGLARPQRPRETVWLLVQQGLLRLLVGDLDAAQLLLSKARASAETITDPSLTAAVCELAAEIALDSGDAPAARAAIDEALAVYAPITEDPQQLLEPLSVAARIEAEIGAVPGLQSPDRLTRLHELLSASVSQLKGYQRHAHVEAALCEAELARAGGSDVEDMWRGLVREAGELRRPYLRAYALLRLAEAALRTKNRSAARSALVDSHRIAVGLGATPLTRRIEQTAQRTRIGLEGAPSLSSPGSVAPRVAALGLTPREVDVLRLLTTGRTNRQIASHLGMAEKTASVHVSRILVKLGVSTRGEAAACAVRLRLLDD